MSSELLVVSFNENFGFINRKGKLVIPLQYASAGWFSEGLARVLIPGEKNRYAFIDESGAIVFEPRWGTKRPEFCSVMSDGMVQVGFKAKKGSLTGYFTRTGELAIKPQYEFMSRSFENGVALVEDINGKKRFIDKTGATRFGDFDRASSFSEGMAKVVIKFKSGFIDSHGRRVIPVKYSYVDDFSDGLAVFEDKSGKRGYLDKNGNVVIPPNPEPCPRF